MFGKLYRKWLYRKIDNSFIYEVVVHPTDSSQRTLFGPLSSDTIRIAAKKFKEKEKGDYRYVQIIDGKIMAAFKENELLFLNKPL